MAQEDLITRVVLPANPKKPTEFLESLKQAGYPPTFHVVSNRGACNPAKGSFSVFGNVGQDLSFGVFVEPSSSGVLELQNEYNTRLMVEVIAKDKKTGLKNFWELIGDGESSAWHYRGNSLDVLADIQDINIKPTNEPVFGERLRCSGCHTGGDMVMKERFPYNDWQTDTPLSQGPWRASRWVNKVFGEAESAHHLNTVVEQSLRDYVSVLRQRSPETSKQWSRSVLAPLEMNLVSDSVPFRQRREQNSAIAIPAAFFVDPLLSGEQPPVEVPFSVYQRALRSLGSSFAPEESAGLLETQHAFLVPVRSRFDEIRIETLLDQDLWSSEVLSDLLAYDFETAMYSPKRLALLAEFPEHWESAEDLRADLLSNSAIPHEVWENLMSPGRDRDYHRQRALDFLEERRKESRNLQSVKGWIRLAAQRRLEIQASQTSQNPRGQILEGGLGPDGFRRIFPSYSKL